jgi:hypothetical protein
MRTRLLPAGGALALVLGLLTALPALAAYDDPVITFPGGSPEFYSPFSGPATVTFTYEATDNDATFEIRLRPQGGTAIRTKQVFIDPDSQPSPRVVQFSWPALSVGSTRTYQVAVYRGGNLQGSPESFQLHPPLAVITRATPNPFLPWITDGYKDKTRIRFTLAGGVSDAEARVFKANSNGKCCGSLIRDESLGNLSAGSNHWDWDGKGEGGFAGFRPAGNYFVKIWADDGTAPPAVSKPFKVRIVRTYRATDIKTKPGTAYHHTTESALVRGGDCFLHNQGSFLQIDCHGGRMTVYYRWGLDSDERIEAASFVMDDPNNECGSARRSTGHSTHDSFITVTDTVSGITSCHVVTAKVTYSYLKLS